MTSRHHRPLSALAAAGFAASVLIGANVRVSSQESATPEQIGRRVYAEHCESCHGADRSGVTSPHDIGIERFRSAIRDGVGQMPGFPETMITAEQLDALVAYVLNPSAGVPKIAAVPGSLSRSGASAK